MLKIRLQRIGKKNDPTFRVVVTDSQKGPKSANYVENLGSYNPHVNNVVLKADRIKHWISVGAQVSDTVHNILVKEKVIEGKTRNVLPKKSPIVKEEEEEKTEETAPEGEAPAEEAAEETPAEEAAPEAEAKEEAPAEEPQEEDKKEE